MLFAEVYHNHSFRVMAEIIMLKIYAYYKRSDPVTLLLCHYYGWTYKGRSKHNCDISEQCSHPYMTHSLTLKRLGKSKNIFTQCTLKDDRLAPGLMILLLSSAI